MPHKNEDQLRSPEPHKASHKSTHPWSSCSYSQTGGKDRIASFSNRLLPLLLGHTINSLTLTAEHQLFCFCSTPGYWDSGTETGHRRTYSLNDSRNENGENMSWKNTGCSYRTWVVSSTHPVLDDLMSSSGLQEHHTHIVHGHSCSQNIRIHKVKLNRISKQKETRNIYK